MSNENTAAVEAPAVENQAEENKVVKSELIRKYLAANPDAGPTAVQKALLKEHGVEVSTALVSQQKNGGSGKGTKGTKGRKSSKKPDFSAAIGQLVAMRQLVVDLGGPQAVRDALAVAAKVEAEFGSHEAALEGLDAVAKLFPEDGEPEADADADVSDDDVEDDDDE